MFEFEEYQIVLSLYKFYKETITWLIESFDEKKEIKLVVYKQNSVVNIVFDDNLTRIVRFHHLLFLKLNEIMLDERLTEEKKRVEFLNLKYFDKDTFENIIILNKIVTLIKLFDFLFSFFRKKMYFFIPGN